MIVEGQKGAYTMIYNLKVHRVLPKSWDLAQGCIHVMDEAPCLKVFKGTIHFLVDLLWNSVSPVGILGFVLFCFVLFCFLLSNLLMGILWACGSGLSSTDVCHFPLFLKSFIIWLIAILSKTTATIILVIFHLSLFLPWSLSRPIHYQQLHWLHKL